MTRQVLEAATPADGHSHGEQLYRHRRVPGAARRGAALCRTTCRSWPSTISPTTWCCTRPRRSPCSLVYQMGKRAAELLIDRLQGAGQDEPQDIQLPSEIIVRGSSGHRRCRGSRRSDHWRISRRAATHNESRCGMTSRSIAMLALLVREYDEAIAFFAGVLGSKAPPKTRRWGMGSAGSWSRRPADAARARRWWSRWPRATGAGRPPGRRAGVRCSWRPTTSRGITGAWSASGVRFAEAPRAKRRTGGWWCSWTCTGTGGICWAMCGVPLRLSFSGQSNGGAIKSRFDAKPFAYQSPEGWSQRSKMARVFRPQEHPDRADDSHAQGFGGDTRPAIIEPDNQTTARQCICDHGSFASTQSRLRQSCEHFVVYFHTAGPLEAAGVHRIRAEKPTSIEAR